MQSLLQERVDPVLGGRAGSAEWWSGGGCWWEAGEITSYPLTRSNVRLSVTEGSLATGATLQ